MIKFNILDIHSIQECLTAYRALIQWMPITCLEEMDLKEERLKVIEYLEGKCEDALAKAEEVAHNE